jgi:DNA-binding MarR family transcriptional regulator
VADIRRAVTRLARRLRSERAAGALSPNQLSVLSYLYRNGPSSPGDLAAHEHQQPQSLTRVFAELAADGLVSRSRSDLDRRQSVLDITAAGRAVLERDMAGRDAWLAAALGELTATETQLLQLAAILMDRLADAKPALSGPALSGRH